MTGQQCKELALKILKGNTLIAFVVTLIFSAITAALSTITAGIGVFLVSSLLTISLYNVFINAYKGKGYEVKDMVDGLDEGLTNRICLSVLKNIYIALWSLLFIIPGIVKSYSYFLTEFISREHPEKTATECIDESRKLMDGHKADLFMFHLSFIGWVILGAFTFGILYIWLLPYIHQATVIYIDKNIYKLSVSKSKKNESKVEEVFETTATFVDEEYKYCAKCGTKLSKAAEFCSSCGTKQNNNE